MAIGVIAIVFPLLGVLVVAAVVALAVALANRPTPAPSYAAEAARKHAIAVNAVAWLLPFLIGPVLLTPVAVVALRVGLDGAAWNAALVGLYPAAIGLGFLAVHAVGERTWPRPTGTVRRAALVPRSVRDVVPTWLHRLTWTWGGALVLVLLVTGLTADEGHLLRRAGDTVSQAASPYPGWRYGLPLLVAAALVVAATEGVLRLVARRPAVVDADPTYDAASRRLSSHRVLRGTQLVLALCLAGVLVVSGSALIGVDLDALGVAATVAGAGVALAGVVVAVIPAPAPVSGQAPPAPADGPMPPAATGDRGAPAPAPESGHRP